MEVDFAEMFRKLRKKKVSDLEYCSDSEEKEC